MRILKRIVFFVSVYIISLTQILALEYCEQVINVKFTPYAGVRVYTVSGGNNDKRGVIDLGHFNGNMDNQKVKIGKIEVDIEMIDGKSDSNSNYEVEIINPEKLANSISDYTNHVTQFIKGGIDNPEAKIIFENFRIMEARNGGGEIGWKGVNFSCSGNNHNNHAKKFIYSFDLLIEFQKISDRGMYGFSPNKKNGGTGAYINIKDLVLEQIRKTQSGK